MSELLNPYGKDEFGNYVHVDDARKGVNYVCPDKECNIDLILHKSKGGLRSKQTHFTHRVKNPNCTPEGLLHYIFKERLYKLLLDKLKQREVFEMKWMCNYLKGISYHKGNILKNISSVKLEKNVGSFRPDISLYDKDGKPISVIEVIVTHSPTDEAQTYYHNNGIMVIEFFLEDFETLIVLLENSVLGPSSVAIPSYRGGKCLYCLNDEES